MRPMTLVPLALVSAGLALTASACQNGDAARAAQIPLHAETRRDDLVATSTFDGQILRSVVQQSKEAVAWLEVDYALGTHTYEVPGYHGEFQDPLEFDPHFLEGTNEYMLHLRQVATGREWTTKADYCGSAATNTNWIPDYCAGQNIGGCCRTHDNCYGDGGDIFDKSVCDTSFYGCIESIAGEVCALTYYVGVYYLGWPSFNWGGGGGGDACHINPMSPECILAK